MRAAAESDLKYKKVYGLPMAQGELYTFSTRLTPVGPGVHHFTLGFRLRNDRRIGRSVGVGWNGGHDKSFTAELGENN